MRPQPTRLVVLVEPSGAQHHHADLLTKAAFQVVTLKPEEVTVERILLLKPAIIAVELNGDRAQYAFKLAPLLGADPRTRSLRVIVFGHGLSAQDIETAARGGAMWLQLEPTDGAKLLAAIRGVLAAANSQGETDDR